MTQKHPLTQEEFTVPTRERASSTEQLNFKRIRDIIHYYGINTGSVKRSVF